MALDGQQVITTAERLAARIGERFDGRGIHDRSLELVQVARRTEAITETYTRPIRWVRVALGALAAALAVVALLVPFDLDERSERDAFDWLQVVESVLNDIVFVGIGAVFLVTVEARIKRRRCLIALHELRSFAHVVDMIQLTKDPQRHPGDGQDTPASPERDLTRFELGRYLDYCSELLAITGKVAALHVEHFPDPVALATVTEIENLCSGLTNKIWQKLVILHSLG